MKERIDRRTVLRGFGGALIALPTLQACQSLPGERLGRRSSAVAVPAKRLITMMRPNGIEPVHWFPSGSEASFTLPAQSAAFDAVREHLIMMHGVDNQIAIDNMKAGIANGHAEGVPSLFSGYASLEQPKGSNNWFCTGGPSIDHIVSALQEQLGYVGRAKSIHLGEEDGGGSYNGISVRPDASYQTVFFDFDVLFQDESADSDAARAAALANRQSILDGTKSDFERLAQRISGEDRRRIEQHLEALRSIEKRLESQGTFQCKRPEQREPQNVDERRDLFNDIIAAAFGCDATRVATLAFFHSGGGNLQLPFVDVYEDIHELSHQVVGEPQSDSCHEQFNRYHDWFSRKTVSLVEKLKAIPTADGATVFDETVIVHGSEIGWDHSGPNLPMMILAGSKTPFKTGRYVDFGSGTLHTHVLTSVVQAFGSELTRVGDAKYAAGNLNSSLFA